MRGRLLFVVLHFDRFQVFGFKYLTAIQTFEIIDAIPAGDNLGTGVIASGRHMQRLDEVYFKRAGALVKPFYTPLHPGTQGRAPKEAPERIWKGLGRSGIPMERERIKRYSGAHTAPASLAAIGRVIAASRRCLARFALRSRGGDPSAIRCGRGISPKRPP